MKNTNGNLTIFPLFWVYHDFWKYIETTYTPNDKGENQYHPITYNHKGHIHFFIPNYSVEQPSSFQAFTGKQKYTYDLNQLWSPNLQNENQRYTNRVVGKPKWYFYIEEYWRRIYIQPWQSIKNNRNTDTFLGKKGLKYDASLPQHTRGIFRQGKDNYFFYTDLCRTLPIEYWHNLGKTKRDHYLRMNNANTQYKKLYETFKSDQWERGVNDIASPTWNFGVDENDIESDYPKLRSNITQEDKNRGNYYQCYSHVDEFTIPRQFEAKGDYPYNTKTQMEKQGISSKKVVKKQLRYLSWSDQDGARCNYADRYYIYPTIEYQKVIHKNWQRLDGWQDRDKEDEQYGEQFGDGYNYEITIPYQKNVNGKMVNQSPFSDDNGKVYPPGHYFHNLVSEQNKLHYRREKIENSNNFKYNDYEIAFAYANRKRENWCYPSDRQVVEDNGLFKQWNVPENYPIDGIWVEQCLGAIVKAKVKVITEDFLGGRTVNWVEDTAFSIADPFEGVQI